MVTLLYNKFMELTTLSFTAREKNLSNHLLGSIDKDIVDKVLNEICADINLVAKRKTLFNLWQVSECLNLSRLPALKSPRSAAAADNLQS